MKKWTGVLGLALAVMAASSAAVAQETEASFPSRDIKFICGFPAGSGADTYVRYYAEKLRPILGRTILIENRVGANGNIATAYVAKSKPDGYTIYLNAPSGLAANMHLFKNAGTDGPRELQIVATLLRQSFMITVAADRPWKTPADMVATLKEKGDKGSYATNNPTGRVAGAWLKSLTGLQTLEVQYKTGADTLNDLASGALDFAVHDPVTALAQKNAGRLKILAVTVKERMQAAPEIPALAEFGWPVDLPSWWAAMAPMGTPRPVIDKLHAAFNQVTSTDESRQFFAKFGADPLVMTPEAAQKWFADDEKAWGEHIKLAKIEPQG